MQQVQVARWLAARAAAWAIRTIRPSAPGVDIRCKLLCEDSSPALPRAAALQQQWSGSHQVGRPQCSQMEAP